MRTLTLLLLAVLSMTATPSWADCFDDAAAFHSVNPWILRGIAGVESSFNPNAVHKNKNGSVDYGVTQINSIHLPALAKQGIHERDLFDACTSVYVGAWLLRKRIDADGNTCKAIGSYKSKTPSIRDNYTQLIKHQLGVWGVKLDC